MTILITGGTGKTGAPLAQKIHDAGHSVLVASRSGSAPEHLKGVKFDWNDPSTFENPFNADPNIDKIYLICPPVSDRLTPMKPFIDLAVAKSVKRFVLLSATVTPPGGGFTGEVHDYLAGLEGVEYGVLRPSWFSENFKSLWLRGILNDNEIVTATQDGKLPFVAVADIVDAAFNLLTTPEIENPDLLVIGPDLLSYDQAAEILSAALGRKISHRKVTVAEATEIRKGYGLPAEIAGFLGHLDDTVAQGNEEKVVEENNKYVGKVRLADWVEENKAAWQKV
ncbi:NAD(P)-binding protein [Pluteus cervinus]|uniref:NAD(P)-binding protein n=1 Tax=Pluteus cervinus TaxID=181527 RepID=A0ACD3A876_9AGAR|nr:NAD(P)-binding protein [Pluteus cervinus]